MTRITSFSSRSSPIGTLLLPSSAAAVHSPYENLTADTPKRKSSIPKGETMKQAALTILLLATLTGVAQATRMDFRTGDPRKCGYGPTRKDDCARNAAEWTLRVAMSKRLGLSTPRWTSIITCTPTRVNLLQWSCHFGLTGPGAGTATVTFRATSTGWHRYVTARCDDASKANPPSCR